MGAGPTGVGELDAVLQELTGAVQRILGDGLVGVYLQGSFALGGWDAESDCDVLVVPAEPVGAPELAALRAFHADLPARPGYWNAHLELSYPPAGDLADLATTGRPWPYVDHGSDRVVHDAHCNTAVTRWILHEHGVRLLGPDPRAFTAPVPAGVLRSEARAGLQRAVAQWEQHGPWDAWSQRYAVVSLPRMLRTQLVGDVVSKPAAVAWALTVLDAEWASLLRSALAARGGRPWDAPIDPALAARTLEFVRYVGRVASAS